MLASAGKQWTSMSRVSTPSPARCRSSCCRATIMPAPEDTHLVFRPVSRKLNSINVQVMRAWVPVARSIGASGEIQCG